MRVSNSIKCCFFSYIRNCFSADHDALINKYIFFLTLEIVFPADHDDVAAIGAPEELPDFHVGEDLVDDNHGYDDVVDDVDEHLGNDDIVDDNVFNPEDIIRNWNIDGGN